ncbi:hypothetical protein ACMZOO_04335 [Catenovulum sp. SX2]|uniref:hypothetical protein n=1 Tax=Catenovulum sp. SX2 TaxID=3398614 RepID=UPI003F870B5E
MPETDDCQSTLFIKTKNGNYEFENLLGEFYLSTINNQIFDCGGNELRYGMNANIINANGQFLSIYHPNGVAKCGVTEDNKFYFIVDESPVLKVYNNKAELLLSMPVKFNSSVNYNINNVAYELWVPSIP